MAVSCPSRCIKIKINVSYPETLMVVPDPEQSCWMRYHYKVKSLDDNYIVSITFLLFWLWDQLAYPTSALVSVVVGTRSQWDY